jgi:phage baseplate assembly protein V
MSTMMEQLGGRLASMLGFARITATKDLGGKGLRSVQVTFDAAESRDGTPVVQQYGFASRPKVGADAVVTFIGGNRSLGIIIATNDRRFQIELAEGEVALHTDEGDKVHLKRGRIVSIVAGTQLEIDTPLITTTGRIEATGDIKAGTISLQNHRHGGVQSGGAQTAVPTP